MWSRKLAISLMFVGFFRPAPAGAAEPGPLVVLPAQVSNPAAQATGASVERLVRARLDARPGERIGPTPAIGLPDLLLAVGCAAPTDPCLAAVANELQAGALLLPGVDGAGASTVISLAWFHEGRTERASEAAGSEAPPDVVAAVDRLLSRLMGLSGPVVTAPPSEPPPGVAGSVPPPPAEVERDWRLPAVVGGTGLAALATGGVLGLLSAKNESDYAGMDIRTAADADRAIERRGTAESQATAANVLFGLGGLLVSTGAVLYFGLDGPPLGGEP